MMMFLRKGSALRGALRYYPLTIQGTVLLCTGLYLLGIGYGRGNPYAILIALLSLLTLIVLSIAGRMEASGIGSEDVLWDTSVPLIARRGDVFQRVETKKRGSILFFRFHFSLGGSLQVEGKSRYYLYREVSFPGSTGILSLWLPFSGIIQCVGSFSVQDVFGLTRSRTSFIRSRRLIVLPYHSSLSTEAADAVTGTDSLEKQREAENEKYYMREYMAGDRFRDINWKASTRTEDIFTRVSPESIEETTLITVVFRRLFSLPSRICKDSPLGVSQLNAIKSFFLAFITDIQRRKPEFKFAVHLQDEIILIETKGDLISLASRLGELFYSREECFPNFQEKPASLFVFTTLFDHGLSDFVNRVECPVYIYRTVFPKKNASRMEDSPDITVSSLWRPEAEWTVPGTWVLKGKRGIREYSMGNPGRPAVMVDLPVLPRLFPKELSGV